MVNVLTIIVPIIICLVFLAVSFYLYTMFCHPQDQGIGTSLFAKIIIIFGQALAWTHLLIILLDLGLQSDINQSSIMIIIYSVIYILIFALTVFIMPFISALYQADQQDSNLKQFLKSLIYAFIIAFVWSAFTFLSYIGLSIYSDKFGYDQRVDVILYMMLCQGLVGWILLVINGALGLVFVPYDLINGFIHRPKILTKQQAYDLKTQLQTRSDQLIQQGQKLQIQEQQFKEKANQMNFFTRRKRQSQIQKLLNKFKNDINQLENDYQNFEQQVKIKDQNPVIPYLKLITGILSVIISLVWIVQLLGQTIHINNLPAFQFLDGIFYNLSQGSAGFVSAILYGIMVLYMQACLIKGNIIFGIRIPFVIKFHPLQLNKTYLNSLLFNTLMMFLTSISILQMSLMVFPRFLDSTFLGNFFINEVSYKLPLFGFLYGDRIYLIVFLGFVGISIIYFIVILCLNHRKQNNKKAIQKQKLIK